MLLGERVQRNFPTRTEAETFYDNSTRGLDSDDRPKSSVLTWLTEEQVRKIEHVVLQLPEDKDIEDAVMFFKKHYKPLMPIPWEEAIEGYESHLIHERKTDPDTAGYRATALRSFSRIAIKRRATKTDELTAQIAKEWIYRKDLIARSQRDGYDRLNQFVSWLVRERHATFNPVPDLVRPKVRAKEPRVLTPDELKRLLNMAWTDPEGPSMLPHFAICSLSGVRPSECQGLEPRSIHLTGKHPIIEVNKNKSNTRRRFVELTPALVAILKVCAKLDLSPGYFSKRKFDRIRRDAGVFDRWEKDISRHGYASYTYEIEHDIKALEKNMDNSADVLFTHYLRAVKRADAKRYLSPKIDWKASPRKGMMGGRVDRWALRDESELTADQIAAVARYKKKKSKQLQIEPPYTDAQHDDD